LLISREWRVNSFRRWEIGRKRGWKGDDGGWNSREKTFNIEHSGPNVQAMMNEEIKNPGIENRLKPDRMDSSNNLCA
jgi:hypothetical protein